MISIGQKLLMQRKQLFLCKRLVRGSKRQVVGTFSVGRVVHQTATTSFSRKTISHCMIKDIFPIRQSQPSGGPAGMEQEGQIACQYDWPSSRFISLLLDSNQLAWGRSPGLVVIGGGSCSKDREFESQHVILDGHFSHLFVLKIVMCV